MPFKNTQKYIKTCIESILIQSHRNFELLAVDDHSSDDSYKIISEFAKLDPRIKVFKNPSKGILPGLDYVYSQKSGSYITRMDSDDIMPQNKLTELKNILDSSKVPTVATGLVQYFCDENKIGLGFVRYQNWLNEISKKSSHYQDIYTECPVASPCWMMYSKDYDSIGAYQIKTYPEDYDLFYRWYQAKFEIKASQKILHLWRDHQTRASRNDPNYLDQCFFTIKIKYFKKFHYKRERPLVVWGAGPKGKKLIKELQKQNLQPQWICENPKKVGQTIYDIQLKDINFILSLTKPIILLAVSQKNSLNLMYKQLENFHLKANEDFFNFVI